MRMMISNRRRGIWLQLAPVVALLAWAFGVLLRSSL